MKFIAFKQVAAAILITGAFTHCALADDTYVAPVEDAFELGLSQYAAGRYGEAFGNLFWAAIRDHARAQEIVGLMYLLGPRVYGPSVRSDRTEAQFWLTEAGKRGRAATRSMECALAQADKRVLAPALVMACLRN